MHDLVRKHVIFAIVFLVFGLPDLALESVLAQGRRADGSQGIEVLDRLSFDDALALYRDCGLRKVDRDEFARRMPRTEGPRAKQQTTATISVNFSADFPEEARRAFNRAVEVWESRIESPVTIRILARWDNLGTNTLGAAGPLLALVDTNGDNSGDAYLGFPLLDAVTGQDQAPDEIDIVSRFNSSRDDWHFGQEPAPSGTIDFTSIALHEITHGLNYIDLFNYSTSDGRGGYGIDIDENGQIDEDERVPGPYDQQLVLKRQNSSTFVSLTNESEFPNPSLSIGDALTSDRLFFAGRASRQGARQGSGPNPPKIFAPAAFFPGSSISHLDESTYPSGSLNALMTPRANSAETNRMVGPIVCGQMKDMGWPLGPDCAQYVSDVFAFQASPSASGGLQLSWEVGREADVEEYIFERQYFDEGFEVVRRADPSALPDTTVTFNNLGIGVFSFRLRWVRSDGTVGEVPTTVRDTINIQNLDNQVGPLDEQGRRPVTLSWEEPPGTNGFRYVVQRRRGTKGSFQTAATRQKTSFTAERQTPGKYQYRVRAEDGSGNSLVSPRESVQIGFEGSVYALGPYPNPARNVATVDLTARQDQPVTVEVYTSLGERIFSERRMVRAQAPVTLTISTGTWASGTYFLRVRGEQFTRTRKMVVLK